MKDKKENKNESWIKQFWRPCMAWQYFIVCLFDFIIAPAITMYISKETGVSIQWDPLTLKESGFYHMSMGAILGVAAWTRGQEKIRRLSYHDSDDDRDERYHRSNIERTITNQEPVR